MQHIKITCFFFLKKNWQIKDHEAWSALDVYSIIIKLCGGKQADVVLENKNQEFHNWIRMNATRRENDTGPDLDF